MDPIFETGSYFEIPTLLNSIDNTITSIENWTKIWIQFTPNVGIWSTNLNRGRMNCNRNSGIFSKVMLFRIFFQPIESVLMPVFRQNYMTSLISLQISNESFTCEMYTLEHTVHAYDACIRRMPKQPIYAFVPSDRMSAWVKLRTGGGG